MSDPYWSTKATRSAAQGGEERERHVVCFVVFFFNFYCEMWGFVCLNVVQENLTNNVLSWDKCQGWGGLGFAMQRQGRNKKKKKRGFRKWTAKQLADLLVNNQQLQEQAESSTARNPFPPLFYSPLCSHSTHHNIVSQKEGSTLPRMEVPPHPSPNQASFPATATGLNCGQGTPFLMWVCADAGSSMCPFIHPFNQSLWFKKNSLICYLLG